MVFVDQGQAHTPTPVDVSCVRRERNEELQKERDELPGDSVPPRECFASYKCDSLQEDQEDGQACVWHGVLNQWIEMVGIWRRGSTSS